MAWRTVAVSLPTIIFDAYTALVCWRYRQGPLKSTLRMLAALLLALAISNAFKAFHIAANDLQNMFQPDFLVGQFYIVSVISCVAGTVLMVLLATQNLQAQLDIELAERKRQEASMQQAALVYQTTSEGMIVTDAADTIISVNPAFTRLTGYTPDEVIGRPPFFLSADKHDAAAGEAAWKALAEKGEWQGEMWCRHKAGHLFAEWLNISTLNDPEGKVSQHVGLFHDITEQKRASDTIFRQANFDHLTGLANRNFFFDHLARSLSQARRTGRKVALYFMDLNRFKPINDKFGHESGDFVLKTAAERWQGCVRAEDVLARLGGDEFALIASNIDEENDILQLADKLAKAQAEPITLPCGAERIIGTSIGVAIFPDQAQEMDSLIALADTAMYRHKATGALTIPSTLAIHDIKGSERPWVVIDASHQVGIAAIDGQHRQLVEMVNNLNRALIQRCDDATLKCLFEELILYTAHHFTTEETYMAEHHYPETEAHTREHAELAQELHQIVARFEPGDELRTLQTIKNWLLRHIQFSDKPLGDYLTSRGLS